MPAVTSGKVLVTGANGYIAVWVVKSLLDAGFSVRGTVRSESKAGHLRTLFASAGDKFEVVIVDDITKVRPFPHLPSVRLNIDTPHRQAHSTRTSPTSTRSRTPPRPST